MPIVQKHGQPPAEEIGQEIWNRASLWRFGWRAVYDKTPFTDKDLVEKEWKRFVKQEAVPVIESKMDSIVSAIPANCGGRGNQQSRPIRNGRRCDRVGARP